PTLPDEASGPWGSVAGRSTTTIGPSLFVYGGEFWATGTDGRVLGGAYLWTPPATDFCAVAQVAAEGHGGLERLPTAPGLTDDQRRSVAAAVADAGRQTARGDGWDNSALVEAVNDICD